MKVLHVNEAAFRLSYLFMDHVRTSYLSVSRARSRSPLSHLSVNFGPSPLVDSSRRASARSQGIAAAAAGLHAGDRAARVASAEWYTAWGTTGAISQYSEAS
jgi:hypothetical protein